MPNNKKIYIGADHAGFELKEKIKKHLSTKGIPFEDMGNTELDLQDDYPDFGLAVGKEVSKNNGMGILVCGSSQGVCIVANKVKGVRGVSVDSVKEVKLSREHNNANVLCLSGWETDELTAKRIINAFLKTPFSKAKRHQRRVEKIKKYEKKNLS